MRSEKITLLIALFSIAPAHAVELTRQQQVEILNQGLRAFDHGAEVRQSNPTEAATAFREAVSKFQLLVDSGVRNGKLFYDLANANLESGQLGKAIANYRRAEKLIPGDGQLDANLRYARSLCRTQISASGQRAFLKTLFFWHYDTPLRWRFKVGLVAYIAFWLLLLGRTYVPRAPWAYLLVPCFLLWAALGVSVAGEKFAAPADRVGVIVSDDITVRKGNAESFSPQFEQKLHEGVEFTVLEQRSDWLNIELPDGKSGWIRARDAELL